MIQIVDKSKCCGCGACSQICPKGCIAMLEDNEGFLYPVINKEVCVNCGLCEKVCPVLNVGNPNTPLVSYAAKNNDEDIRMKSSSGGIFSLIAEQVINKGGVVFGARFNDKWEVIHDFTDTIEGLAAFRGSKYTQSRVGDSFKDVSSFLKKGRLVLFSGTPCQVKALKLFLKKEYVNLLTVDFICHGVPSPKVWNLYLTGIANSSRLKEINFRDKSNGWKNCSFKYVTDTEIVQEEFTRNIYMKIFLSNLPLRLSCYECYAKMGKSRSDITLGDFWGIDNCLPTYNDNKGCSALLIYKNTMQNYLQGTNLQIVNYKNISTGNFSLEHSVKKPINRSYFFYLVSKGKSLKSIYQKCFDNSLLVRIRRIFFRITRI